MAEDVGRHHLIVIVITGKSGVWCIKPIKAKKDITGVKNINNEWEGRRNAALIYRESRLRKAEAAAAAKGAKKKKISTTSSTRRRRATTSTRAKSAAAAAVTSKDVESKSKKKKRSLPTEDEEVARKRAQRKKYRYTCSADGCTNKVHCHCPKFDITEPEVYSLLLTSGIDGV